MTLADYATYICTLINQGEPADVAACKSFLQQKFKFIWSDQLWKDSLFEYTQTLVTPGYVPCSSTWLPTKKCLLLPPQIDLPIAVRTDTRKLNVESSETFYRMDFDSFTGSGSVTQFRLLDPCVWDFDTPQLLNAFVTNLADKGVAPLSVRGLDADGVTADFFSLTLGGGLNQCGPLSRISAVTKQATQGQVILNIDGVGNVTATVVGGGPVAGQVARSGVTSGKPTYGGIGGLFIYWSGATWIISFGPGPGPFPQYSSPVDLAEPSLVPTAQWSPTNPPGYGPVVVTGGYTPITTMQPTDLGAGRRQEIQLFGVIPEGTVIRVLGKVQAPAFSSDQDEARLTGVDNTLIAFAHADMLKRSRQYGKAAAMMQEAVALLEQLKRTQVVQQTYNRRLIPEDGYAWDYATPITSPLTF